MLVVANSRCRCAAVECFQVLDPVKDPSLKCIFWAGCPKIAASVTILNCRGYFCGLGFREWCASRLLNCYVLQGWWETDWSTVQEVFAQAKITLAWLSQSAVSGTWKQWTKIHQVYFVDDKQQTKWSWCWYFFACCRFYLFLYICMAV